NVVAISAGNLYNVALRRDGTILAWGNNRNGVTNVPPPAQSNSIAISAGVSHNLALTGIPVWPEINAQPHAIITNTHDTVRFEIVASSTSSIFYQWQHDGVNLPGATNSFLQLDNITEQDVGLYRVVLTANRQKLWSKSAALILFIPVFLNGADSLHVS